MGILIFKGFTARRLYKSFGVKGLNIVESFMYVLKYTQQDGHYQFYNTSDL
jgi:hypothetical protein